MERPLHLGLNGEPFDVTSCDTKVISRTKLLPATQSYFSRYKVTYSCALLSIEGSNFVSQKVTWEGSPCMTKITSSCVLLSFEGSNFV
jgi:hypothetical protein